MSAQAVRWMRVVCKACSRMWDEALAPGLLPPARGSCPHCHERKLTLSPLFSVGVTTRTLPYRSKPQPAQADSAASYHYQTAAMMRWAKLRERRAPA